MIIFTLGLTFIWQVEKCNYPIPQDRIVPAKTISKNIEQFEESKPQSKGDKFFKTTMYDYRSAEPTAKQLDEFLRTHPEVTTVIRLNGEGVDSDGLRVAKERSICEKYGVKFDHLSMITPYEEWAEIIMKTMLKETVLIHCHHGYDRTGFIFAYKLMKYHNYTFDQIRKMNGWDRKKGDINSKQFYSTLRKLEQ